ncbi:MAG TPA: hypothetical protein DCZ80_06770 [Legionellales bacterium]|nr:hypothetical protein [Legionellales bacterium]
MNISLDIDKFYVSPFDKMMREYDAAHDKSISQMKEIEKHKKISNLRDHPIEADAKDKIWAGF